MKKNLLAENYKRLFKARISSNDKALIESLSPRTKKEMIPVVQRIYDEATAGTNMTDDIIDELGDFYDDVWDSNDDKVTSAYDALRSTADGNPKEQANAAKELLTVLGANTNAKLKSGAIYVAYINNKRNAFIVDDLKTINASGPAGAANFIKRKAFAEDNEEVQAFELDKNMYFIVISRDDLQYAVVGNSKSPKYGAFWNLLKTDMKAANDMFYKMNDAASKATAREI